jgi:hypothetical protein
MRAEIERAMELTGMQVDRLRHQVVHRSERESDYERVVREESETLAQEVLEISRRCDVPTTLLYALELLRVRS